MRILHVIGAMDRGGAETMLMNLYRSVDTSEVQFDFLVHETRECDYDAEILARGGRIYRIERLNPLHMHRYYQHAYKLISEHPEWDIIHSHIGSSATLITHAARKLGRVGIAHSHSKHFPLSASELAFRIISYPTRFVAQEFIGCSHEAGVDRFGQQVVAGPHYHMLRNGIDVSQYAFSSEIRARIRTELGLPHDAYVLGHVGRLTPIKNHPFLFDVFEALLREKPDAYLVCVGRGEDESALKQDVKKRGIDARVLFAGVRDDIPQVLMAFDGFVFPSLSEGLGIAAIEAQASGLPTIISTGVPEEVILGSHIKRISCDEGADVWVDNLLSLSISAYDRCDNLSAIRDAGYDVKVSAQELTGWYKTWAEQNR